MTGQPSLSRETLIKTITAARRRLYLQSFAGALVRVWLVVLPIAAVAVAVDQRWGAGTLSFWLALSALTFCVLAPVAWAAHRLRSPLASALAIDEGALLKDRISSAWEFLHDGAELDEPRLLQIRDAIHHAERVNVGSLFRPRFSRTAVMLPVFCALFIASFFVPARFNPQIAEASVDARRQLQLQELLAAREEIEPEAKDSKELEEVIRTLKNIEKRFQQGEMSERDVMIELARLDEDLRKQSMQPGIEALQGEVNQLVPHLMANEVSRAAAMAIQEQKLDKAGEEIDKLADKEQKQELSKEDKDKLAMNLGVAASKLGGDNKSSLAGDLARASEGLKSGDSKKFSDSCNSMSKKMSSLNKFMQMKKTSKRLSMCKSLLGQCKACKECNGDGCSSCNGGQTKGQKPSLNWGKGTSDPLGNPNRIAASYRKMLEVSGQATGEGEVESEVEMTEGKTSESKVEAKDVYANYASVAEEAIDREEIPLSHRFHVKRYFQAIRPTE